MPARGIRKVGVSVPLRKLWRTPEVIHAGSPADCAEHVYHLCCLSPDPHDAAILLSDSTILGKKDGVRSGAADREMCGAD